MEGMRSIEAAGAFTVMFQAVLPGGYSNLIATADGNTVYVQARSFDSAGWYAVRTSNSGPAIEPQ